MQFKYNRFRTVHYAIKAKFHYAIQLTSSSLAGRIPAREPAHEPASELDSVMEFGLYEISVRHVSHFMLHVRCPGENRKKK